MNKSYKILLFVLILFSNCFAQVADSTSKGVRGHFYFENDISGCINYIVNSSKTSNKIYFNYVNGGIGISLQKKQDKLLSSDFCLSYNYIESVRKLSSIQKEYSTGISYYNEKEIFKNILLEHRLFYNRKVTNSGFYTNLGVGIGNYSHMFDNFMQIKKQNWNLIGGLGYKFIIKRFFIDAHLSMLTLSTYKDVQDYNKDMSTYPDFPLTFGQDDNAKNYVKKIEFDGNSKITRTYKYLGIVNSGFIPRFGINLGFRF